ncbi:MAG TPA: 4-hydroxyphenylpyruvate dioxygenase [Chitinophagaceae bacterium]|nr:4-hydroxyphenylpyruvate dioxygenase [Chitinophagaceae bacterium]
MSSTTTSKNKVSEQKDFLPLLGTDYIEFYVGNAKQAAHYYITAFGFQPLAYEGPETGIRDRASYVVSQNKLTFVFTAPIKPNNPIADHVHKHGDGVKVLALLVEDAANAWKETTMRGAKTYMEPTVLKDESGEVVLSGIQLYGDTVHVFVERKNYHGVFMPGYSKWEIPHFKGTDVGLQYVDHCVGNVGWNQMNRWVKFYEDTMGFKNILSFDDEDISTEYSALMSKVMSNENGFVKFPINEPAEGKKKSQVEEYLEFYNGEGVQHIAMATNDIVATVKELMIRGVEFLRVPNSYYGDLLSRVGPIDEDLEPLKELGILVDRDNEGYLLQLFSKPVEDRPTLFFEIIQRKGARSFGKGNFKALFEAIEREQALRGNL